MQMEPYAGSGQTALGRLGLVDSDSTNQGRRPPQGSNHQ